MARDTALAAACLRSALVACVLHCASSGAPSTFDAQMHHWELKDELGLAGLPAGVAPRRSPLTSSSDSLPAAHSSCGATPSLPFAPRPDRTTSPKES